MTHCVFFKCLMNESDSIPLAESQPLFLCPVCLRKLRKVLKFDIQSRYEKILAQLKNLEKKLVDTCTCFQHVYDTSTDEEETYDKHSVETVKVLHTNDISIGNGEHLRKSESCFKHACQLRFLNEALWWLKGHVE